MQIAWHSTMFPAMVHPLTHAASCLPQYSAGSGCFTSPMCSARVMGPVEAVCHAYGLTDSAGISDTPRCRRMTRPPSSSKRSRKSISSGP